MQEKVELIKNNGEKVSLDVISIFKSTSHGDEKEYILLTENEIDPNGLVKILASEICDGRLIKIENADEWSLVKNAMRAIISSSKGDFEYVNPGNVTLSFVVAEDFAKVIAIQEVAKQQLVKDYIDNKPELVVENTPEPAAVEEDPNSALYPKDSNDDSNDNEVIPGIAEVTEMDKEPTIESQKSEVGVEPSFQVVTEENVSGMDNNNTEIKPAEVDNGRDLAKEEMMNKIMTAVEEYVSTFKNESKDNLEIDELKRNIANMQEQLEIMSSTINTQE